MSVESDVVREATRADLPRGREAQCPLCWRIFGSDSTCETHKPYRRPVTPTCKEPTSIGLQSRPRRGLDIWVLPMDPDALERRTARNGGKPGEQGHADLERLLYVIILVLFIVVLLRLLGIAI